MNHGGEYNLGVSTSTMQGVGKGGCFFPWCFAVSGFFTAILTAGIYVYL